MHPHGGALLAPASAFDKTLKLDDSSDLVENLPRVPALKGLPQKSSLVLGQESDVFGKGVFLGGSHRAT